MLSWLRTIFFTGPLVLLLTTFYGTLDLIASFLDRTGNWQHTIAQHWSRALLFVGGVKVRLKGLENIQVNGSYVFASNHLSFSDTPLMLAHIPCQFRFLAKHGLFKIPFIGFHLRRGGHIPVPRENARAAVRSIHEAGRIIRERGISVLMFPEGGRTDGELRPFKEGAAMIAIAAGVPLVPVAVKGTREIMPMGSLRMVPGKVELRIGIPISTAGMTSKDRTALNAGAREQVAAMLAEINAR
ncbi:MAG: 1-acyl-sn-glycerol-3-phosphate acyltransferase [Candidatus Solibacter usitatus]|nr:1-acyl-sn-glycerol-3-phosphate acyltransferase [Candidatus Solibacter usitatus]